MGLRAGHKPSVSQPLPKTARGRGNRSSAAEGWEGLQPGQPPGGCMEGMQQDASHRDLTFFQGFKAQIEKHLSGLMYLGFSWARAGLQIQP